MPNSVIITKPLLNTICILKSIEFKQKYIIWIALTNINKIWRTRNLSIKKKCMPKWFSRKTLILLWKVLHLQNNNIFKFLCTAKYILSRSQKKETYYQLKKLSALSHLRQKRMTIWKTIAFTKILLFFKLCMHQRQVQNSSTLMTIIHYHTEKSFAS